MKKINLILGIHCHQPIGNFDSVFENTYCQSYLPFLKVLETYPEIKFTLHYSGVLLEWLEKNHSEYFDIIRKLVNRGQVEILGGAFYEPIISVIPDNDKVGQIRLLTEYIKKNFNYDVKGMWLAERVWETHLPKIIKEAGINYTVLDDSHFLNTGLKPNQILGYFKTEEQGEYINIFPISEKLRYNIPFRLPDETVNYLKEISSDDREELVVMIDDGEKFGTWPGTYNWVYKEKWLTNFFDLLIGNKEWINLLTCSEYLNRESPKGIIYIANGSYTEMSEWTLPEDDEERLENMKSELKSRNQFDYYKSLLRGGFWRNYFFKYSESNLMHKKMLLVNQKISKSNAPSNVKEEAKRELWKGQCNCGYWHGIFGGLYLPHLRGAIYEHLINAEKIIEQSIYNGEKNWVEIKKEDLNGDGHEEIVVNTSQANYYFYPYKGGTLNELDFKYPSINILDTFMRRKEFYHKKILENLNKIKENSENDTKSIHDNFTSKEIGLEKYLYYDCYEHKYFIDHFLSKDTTLYSFQNAYYKELGNFVNQPYSYDFIDDDKFLKIIFKRNGLVYSKDNKEPISIIKSISINKEKVDLNIEYTIKNLSKNELSIWFGIEFAFNLLAGEAHDRYYKFPGKQLKNNFLNSIGEEDNISTMEVFDEWLGIKMDFSFSIPCLLWRFPIETISQSENGIEKIYQSSVILPNWNLNISGLGEWKVNINNSIKKINNA